MNCTSRCVYTYTAVQEVSVTDIDMTLIWEFGRQLKLTFINYTATATVY